MDVYNVHVLNSPCQEFFGFVFFNNYFDASVYFL